jgi:hypothetical protein
MMNNDSDNNSALCPDVLPWQECDRHSFLRFTGASTAVVRNIEISPKTAQLESLQLSGAPYLQDGLDHCYLHCNLVRGPHRPMGYTPRWLGKLHLPLFITLSPTTPLTYAQYPPPPTLYLLARAARRYIRQTGAATVRRRPRWLS